MTVSIASNCPFCKTINASFSGAQFMQTPGAYSYRLLMRCGVCGECIVARFDSMSFPDWLSTHRTTAMRGLEPTAVYPNPQTPNYPKHLPGNVQRFYEQAEDAFRRKNWDSAGTMFRKSLDVGLNALDQSGSGNLQKRIDSLPEAIGVTPAMKAWAHQIRRLGNDAAHDDDPFTEEEAQDLKSFSELFLTYAFTLPGMLAQRHPPNAAPPAA